ncbi:hypothetical protein E2C01_003037 [Portunus trituberculatus]|uniref:Uncharacterized protein n=1 Tax=Portunus trituberculatus TaxID=210409 RepID=A0A5B7CSF7_PORTR|nr:hypothetical protein [Portunus trituberculatus]
MNETRIVRPLPSPSLPLSLPPSRSFTRRYVTTRHEYNPSHSSRRSGREQGRRAGQCLGRGC